MTAKFIPSQEQRELVVRMLGASATMSQMTAAIGLRRGSSAFKRAFRAELQAGRQSVPCFVCGAVSSVPDAKTCCEAHRRERARILSRAYRTQNKRPQNKKEQRRQRGRPEHRPTDKQRRVVMELATAGVEHGSIASAAGISTFILRKYYGGSLEPTGEMKAKMKDKLEEARAHRGERAKEKARMRRAKTAAIVEAFRDLGLFPKRACGPRKIAAAPVTPPQIRGLPYRAIARRVFREGRPLHRVTNERRWTIMDLAADGISHQGIGIALGIDPKTLRKHYSMELELGCQQAKEIRAQAKARPKTKGGTQRTYYEANRESLLDASKARYRQRMAVVTAYRETLAEEEGANDDTGTHERGIDRREEAIMEEC